MTARAAADMTRTPCRAMSARELVDILGDLAGAGVETWLDGGWGVDALLGEQTREHDDLDLVLSVDDSLRLVETLGRRGFAVVDGELDSNFVLHDGTGLQVDVHPVSFDAQGDGLYRKVNGEVWTYPADGFRGRGAVLGRPVRCLTPEVQVLCHAGYELDKTDWRDLGLLAERFGVEVPPRYA